MGRLGPLTSQGLGRSPYDDVVQGEGEADPREPPQQYDERGRPVNPVTRQINRDIIRSHNEVMQVIGVAEPENMASEPQAISQEHLEWEEAIGLRLLANGRCVHASAACGVNGMRQRILLYQTYSHVPLLQLWNYERRQRSLTAIFLAGFPAVATVAYSKFVSPMIPWRIDHPYYLPVYKALEGWIRLHLNIFAVLQQLDILPARSFFPDYKFFIPLTSSSPIPAPPPPAAFTPGEITKWVGSLALNAAPVLAVYACDRLWKGVRQEIWNHIRSQLPGPPFHPNPRHRSSFATILDAFTTFRVHTPAPVGTPSETAPQLGTPPAEPTPGVQPELNRGGFPTTSQMRPREEQHGQQEVMPTEEGEPITTDPVSLGTVGTQSSPAHGEAGGGGSADAFYASDDEDNSGDMVSTTLISFDVEATDATEPPPGQWSAELRPNVVEGNRSDGTVHSRTARQPIYRTTTLTRLPSVLAGDMLHWVPSRLLSAPMDAVLWRWVVRSFLNARGLSVEAVYPIWSFGLSKHAIASFLGIELVHFFILFDVWAAMFPIASYFQESTEEWEEERRYLDWRREVD